jgi:hypothetical protein
MAYKTKLLFIRVPLWIAESLQRDADAIGESVAVIHRRILADYYRPLAPPLSRPKPRQPRTKN